MGKYKGKTPERSSARLPAKRNNQAAKSETEKQGCANDPQKKQQACQSDPQKQPEVENPINQNKSLEEMSPPQKSGKLVDLDDNDKQRLDELTELLGFRCPGAAMEGLLPNETKAWCELTKKMGNKKGGQTIDWSRLTQELGFHNVQQTFDWLLPRDAKRLIEVTRELGFTQIGQMIDWLLGILTYKPLLELTNSLGFQDCRQTIEWLLNELEQQNIAAAKSKADLSPALRRPLPSAQFASRSSSALNIPHQFTVNQVGDTLSSANPSVATYNNRQPTQTLNFVDLKKPQSMVHQSFGSHGVPDQMRPPILNATGNQFHQFRMNNSEPWHPLQFQNDTSRWLRENPQQNQFQTNGRDLQGGFPHGENQFSNWMVGQEVSMQQSIQGRSLSNCNYIDVNSHIQMPYPAQGLNRGPHNMYDEIKRRLRGDYAEQEYIGHQLQPHFSTEVGGNPSGSVEIGPRNQAFPSSVTRLAGMPTGLRIQDNITGNDGAEAGTTNAHVFIDGQDAAFLSSLKEKNTSNFGS